MMVIPPPEKNTRSVFIYTGPGTVAMRGGGNVTMLCGNCGSPLVENFKVSQIHGLVILCKNCGSFNESLI
jgi:predicted RNA-binding Zn-ribbon protein involved in translation (DUF1610 family)